MIGIKKAFLQKKLFLAAIFFLAINIGIPALAESELSSVEKLYASLAKLSEGKRQQTLIEGARKEGTITVYGATEERQMKAVMKGFMKRYSGLKIEYFRSRASVILSKALLEIRSNKWLWDTISMGPGYSNLKAANAPAKHFGLLGGPGFPAEGIGEDWIGTQILPLVICFNTEMISAAEAPKSYQELLDPKWKGKVSLDAGPDNLLAAMIKKWGKAKTEAWLDKLVNDNEVLLRRGHTTQTKLLIAGEFPVAAELYAYRVAYEIHEKGVPLDWVIPSDIFEVEIPGECISRYTPNPHGAMLWAQYRVSKEGQTIYGQFGRLPINPQATAKYPRLKEVVKYVSQGGGTILSPLDADYFDQANALIDKIIVPRVRGIR